MRRFTKIQREEVKKLIHKIAKKKILKEPTLQDITNEVNKIIHDKYHFEVTLETVRNLLHK